jgi:hypothetical protein
MAPAGLLAADEGAITRRIGLTSVRLAVPESFVDAGSKDPELLKMVSAVLPATNQAVACLLTEADWKLFSVGEGPDILSPYIVLHTFVPTRARAVTAEEFADVRNVVRTQQQAMVEEIEKGKDASAERGAAALSEFAGSDVEFAVGSILPLGVFAEDEDHISFALLTKNQVDVDGKSIEYSQIVSTTILTVNEKLLYLSVYVTYEDEADLERAKELANEWMSATRTLNSEE